MSDEITPALSEAEWRDMPDCGRVEPRGELPLYFPSRHGIAAVNLHGQNFGFTDDDIRLLEFAAVSCEGTRLDQDTEEGRLAQFLYDSHAKGYRSLLSRIASLLPPPSPGPTT